MASRSRKKVPVTVKIVVDDLVIERTVMASESAPLRVSAEVSVFDPDVMAAMNGAPPSSGDDT